MQTRKYFTLKKKLQKIRIILKTLANFKLSIYAIKEKGVVSFNLKNNVNTFCRFFSNLEDLLLPKLPRPKSKCGIKITEEYYKQNQNECENFVLHNIGVTTVDEILKCLDVVKPFGIDQISAKFLKDDLANIINLSIKRDTFPSK